MPSYPSSKPLFRVVYLGAHFDADLAKPFNWYMEWDPVAVFASINPISVGRSGVNGNPPTGLRAKSNR